MTPRALTDIVSNTIDELRRGLDQHLVGTAVLGRYRARVMRRAGLYEWTVHFDGLGQRVLMVAGRAAFPEAACASAAIRLVEHAHRQPRPRPVRGPRRRGARVA